MDKKEFQNEPGIGLQVIETPLEADEDGLQRLRIDIRRALPDRRLDKYLAGRLGQFSRTALQAYIREGAVTVNSRTVKPSYIIQDADVIEMLLPEPEEKVIAPEPIDLHVLYEDADILAVNKQSGLIVHPARGNPSGTLLNGLAYYFQQHQESLGDLPAPGGWYRPGIVHRLDRDTTGVMLLAKTELALWRLGRQFELRRVHKTYQALVHGILELDEDVIDAPIGNHPRIRERYAVNRNTGKAFGATVKEAVTRYKVLARLTNTGAIAKGFSLVEMYPQTGRTHQLRVHMSFIGHPIVGDSIYGGGPIYQSQLQGRGEVAEGPIITRQALHARAIAFQHPRTLKDMYLRAPLPPDFLAAVRALGGQALAEEFSREPLTKN
jgi:23S rRNA pseudouridine1911/1915/1917 synthase